LRGRARRREKEEEGERESQAVSTPSMEPKNGAHSHDPGIMT